MRTILKPVLTAALTSCLAVGLTVSGSRSAMVRNRTAGRSSRPTRIDRPAELVGHGWPGE